MRFSKVKKKLLCLVSNIISPVTDEASRIFGRELFTKFWRAVSTD